MERVTLITYKGKEIVSIDFKGLTDDDEIIAFLNELKQYLISLNRPTLQLTDLTGVDFSARVFEMVSQSTYEVAPYIRKDAVLGVKGTKRFLFQLYNFIVRGNAKLFDDETAAKEWLVK
jgi:hypothetical protein